MLTPNAASAATDHIAANATGASSKAIAAHLAGVGEPRGDYPMDAGDFDRCEKLLTACPSLRECLPLMAKVNDYWAALAPEWDKIKQASDRTEAIRAIIRPIQDADPMHVRLGNGASVQFVPINKITDQTVAQMKARAQEIRKQQGKPPMKPDPNFDAAADNSYRVTADELRQFIERFERLEAEKKDIADHQKEVMSEAKSRGYDTKVMRKVIALRKRDKDDVAEEEAVLEMYKEALGMT